MIWGKKENNKKVWHLWFAWVPVRLDDGRIVWLELVERKYSYFAIPGGEVYSHRFPTYTVH